MISETNYKFGNFLPLKEMSISLNFYAAPEKIREDSKNVQFESMHTYTLGMIFLELLIGMDWENNVDYWFKLKDPSLFEVEFKNNFEKNIKYTKMIEFLKLMTHPVIGKRTNLKSLLQFWPSEGF